MLFTLEKIRSLLNLLVEKGQKKKYLPKLGSLENSGAKKAADNENVEAADAGKSDGSGNGAEDVLRSTSRQRRVLDLS